MVRFPMARKKGQKKRSYMARCWRCKQVKPVTFRSYISGKEMKTVVDEKTGKQVVVEKQTYRRFPICFDCLKQPK